MEQYTPMLGKRPDLSKDRRDAIHIAIYPAVALERLERAQHAGPLSNGKFGVVDTPCGIVDPFLNETTEEGQTFWFCLYPYTITSLRHVWASSAFKPILPSSER